MCMKLRGQPADLDFKLPMNNLHMNSNAGTRMRRCPWPAGSSRTSQLPRLPPTYAAGIPRGETCWDPQRSVWRSSPHYEHLVNQRHTVTTSQRAHPVAPQTIQSLARPHARHLPDRGEQISVLFSWLRAVPEEQRTGYINWITL